MTRLGRLGACLVWIAIASLAVPAAAQHEHHHPQTAPRESAKTELRDDRDASVLTLRFGPVAIPPRTEHMTAPLGSVSVPFDAWYVAYEPRVVRHDGAPAVGHLLHHVELLNIDRTNFLCPRQPERVFAAGSELSDWPRLPGVGYRVSKGQRLAIAPMFHNPTDQEVSGVFLDVRIHYTLPSAAKLKNVYPAWFLVTHCGATVYDVPPGPSLKASQLVVPYAGKLLGVGGHIHDYGRRLQLENATRHESIATLEIQRRADGRLQSIPTVVFPEGLAHRLSAGDTVKVTALYDNPTGRHLAHAAMGIVVGYFLPDDDDELARQTRDPMSLWRR